LCAGADTARAHGGFTVRTARITRGGRTRAPVVARGLKPRPAGSRGKTRSVLTSSNRSDSLPAPPAGPQREPGQNRLLLMPRVAGKDGERALLTRNGRFERVLEPGRHRLLDPKRELAVEVFQVVRADFPTERYAVLKAARPDLVAGLFEAVETGAGEIAIVKLDGRPVIVLGPWSTRVYFKVATRVEVERIDVASEPKVAPRHLAMIDRTRSTYISETVIENHEAGLLYVEGRFVERLAPGRHAYWSVDRKVEVKRLDL